jgi:hypothetical protein
MSTHYCHSSEFSSLNQWILDNPYFLECSMLRNWLAGIAGLGVEWAISGHIFSRLALSCMDFVARVGVWGKYG